MPKRVVPFVIVLLLSPVFAERAALHYLFMILALRVLSPLSRLRSILQYPPYSLPHLISPLALLLFLSLNGPVSATAAE
ncbi:hypothetical protein BU15DRAFT_81937 [Melanogaster broomeanus]|nr:hypothetical protein BU15DRAFT_81937 [Melanogaster broomeanus]